MDLALLKIALVAYLAAAVGLSLHLLSLRSIARAAGPALLAAAFLGNAVLALAFCVSLVYLFRERQLKEKRIGGLSSRLPSLEALDMLNYRALAWGFPLLTLGIVTGALFAKHTWGRFWSWDERE